MARHGQALGLGFYRFILAFNMFHFITFIYGVGRSVGRRSVSRRSVGRSVGRSSVGCRSLGRSVGRVARSVGRSVGPRSVLAITFYF